MQASCRDVPKIFERGWALPPQPNMVSGEIYSSGRKISFHFESAPDFMIFLRNKKGGLHMAPVFIF